MTFHGPCIVDEQKRSSISESPYLVCVPLIILAIFSVISGFLLFGPILFQTPLLEKSIFVLPQHNIMPLLADNFHGAGYAIIHAIFSPVFWLTIVGIVMATICYVIKPSVPTKIANQFGVIYKILENKYGFDLINDLILVKGSKKLGKVFSTKIDNLVIDKIMVDWLATRFIFIAKIMRKAQTGLLNHYLAYMVSGTLILVLWLMLR